MTEAEEGVLVTFMQDIDRRIYAAGQAVELRIETPPIAGANRPDAEAPALKIAIRELA